MIARPQLATALLVVSTVAAAAAGADSRYTSLVAPGCRSPDQGMDTHYGERGLTALECPAPPGHRLFIVADDARSWIDLEAMGHDWSSEDAIIRDHPVGHFPNVAGSEVAEWRLDGTGAPHALIFRVKAQDPEAPDRSLSQLYVVRIGPGAPCLLGRVSGNDAARALADAAPACASRR